MNIQTYYSFAGRRKLAIRVAIVLAAILGSIVLIANLSTSSIVHAAQMAQASTATNPWGVALDGAGHIWVAEPACDASPVCGTPPAGVIGEYATATDTLIQNFTPPVGNIYNPVFLAIDSSGNIWFTDPTHNLIGELVPTTNTWTVWTVPTASAAPYDLVISGGNLWFSEIGGNAIGFFNTTTHTFVQNIIPTAAANPYGITIAPNGHIWFAENNNAKLGEFVPTANGTVSFIEHSIVNNGPHLLTADAQGNIWFTEGFSGQIGEYTTAGIDREFPVSIGVCPIATPGTTPTPCAGTHISGIAVDSSNNVWFDDSLANRVGVLNPATGTYNAISLINGPTDLNPHPHDGLAVDSSNNVWVSEEFGFQLDKLPPGLVLPTPTSTPTTIATTPITPTTTPTPPPSTTVPVNKTWYFAEGRVGKGFQEYLTLDNPAASTSCAVSIQYLYTYDNTTALQTKTVNLTVSATSRLTEPVNADLRVQSTQNTAADVSAIVTVNATATPACTGIVAERPQYFNFHGVTSGSDVLGATHLGTSYVFADVQTAASATSFISSYFTILNPPGGTQATVIATYYAGGQIVGSQSIQVPAGARRTFSPNAIHLPQHVVAALVSTQPVVVERPSYFSHVSEGNAGVLSSAASVVGAQTPVGDWLFAEGYTGGKFQEYLVLANISTSPLTALIKLEYSGGHFQTLSVNVGALSQTLVDVNQLYTHPSGSCDATPCQLSPEVSLEVRGSAALVAERELFFQYQHNGLSSMGGTDIMGQTGPASVAAYSFAEGYTNVGYNEWLTLQNPTNATEQIAITLMNSYGRSYTQVFTVGATTRFTIDITALVVQHLVRTGDDYRGYEVALSVHETSGAFFVAERPMYWNTSGKSLATLGGSDVLGYTGN